MKSHAASKRKLTELKDKCKNLRKGRKYLAEKLLKCKTRCRDINDWYKRQSCIDKCNEIYKKRLIKSLEREIQILSVMWTLARQRTIRNAITKRIIRLRSMIYSLRGK